LIDKPTPKPRKASIRQDRESSILTSAEQVFAEQGYVGATTALIAKKSGVGKASLHYYFPTKEDLYRRVITNICDTWLSASDDFENIKDPAMALSHYLEEKMDLSRSRPYGSRVWANEIIHGAQFTQDYLNTTVKTWFESRKKIISGWVEKGLIDPIDPATLLYMIWGATQTFSDFEAQIIVLNDGKPLSDEQFAKTKQTVIQTFLKGVGIKVES
jgi:TetR/AcrR family transcriptional regulator